MLSIAGFHYFVLESCSIVLSWSLFQWSRHCFSTLDFVPLFSSGVTIQTRHNLLEWGFELETFIHRSSWQGLLFLLFLGQEVRLLNNRSCVGWNILGLILLKKFQIMELENIRFLIWISVNGLICFLFLIFFNFVSRVIFFLFFILLLCHVNVLFICVSRCFSIYLCVFNVYIYYMCTCALIQTGCDGHISTSQPPWMSVCVC